MAQQNINTGTLPNDKTGDSLRTAMIKVQNNFSELYTTAPISNSVNVGDATSNVTVNSTSVFVGNSGTYSIINSTSITTTTGYYAQVLNSGSNNLVLGTTNATSVSIYTNGITSANLRVFVAANGNVGIGNAAPQQLLTIGGTMSANQIIVGNNTVNFTINATFIPATANYSLSSNTSNSASYIGTLAAANVVSNAQLAANLSNYQTSAGLAANVLVLTSNNTSFVGSVSAANVVSNAQLSSNLSNYLTLSGVAANVLVVTANNTTFVGSVSAANVVSNAQLSANLSNYQTTAGLSANVGKLTSNNSLYAFGKTESDLNVNSASYATSAGSATNATAAGSAVNATNADSATYATTAGTLTTTYGLINAKTALSLSGTTVDFTNIPSSVKRITVMIAGLSTNGSSTPEIRLGTSGGFVSSGYLGATTGTTYTDGFALSNSVTSSNIYHGLVIISNLTGNTWCCFGNIARSDGATTHTLGYSIALAAALTQIRLTMANGTDAFDAGTVNILYE